MNHQLRKFKFTVRIEFGQNFIILIFILISYLNCEWQIVIFEASIVIFRFEFRENLGFDCFWHYGQFTVNGDDRRAVGELEGGRGGSELGKNLS